ncbi:probable disease resistance RPP8-like protein 2 [Rosa rugosa]|uniref:probable disease resistance RPP8-like protein 2 n=1 Tax=Rosa rugosa TaxID=74645 RepID=UPI002B414444|nr:probable disease resistance RPP8-like protein 2 [Rosa rugosa]
MAGAIVSIVVERLASLTNEKLNPSSRRNQVVNNQIQKAQRELELLSSYLEDPNARQSDDEGVIAAIRDAACDLEDVIASFLLKEASNRNGSSMKIIAKRFACSCIGVAADRHKTVSEIKRIMVQLSDLSSSLSSYDIARLEAGIVYATFGPRNQLSWLTFSDDTDHIVNDSERVFYLTRHLVQEQNSPRVLSVWGMGGVGKTTLAKRVYNYDMVRQHFDCLAWVCVSREFQSRDVLQEILTQLISATDEQLRELAKMNAKEIETRLRITQKTKKCFVVLDDIWTCEAWDSLNLGFPREETKSKILLTTRDEQVALHADRKGLIYKVQPLTDPESWKLFEKRAFSRRDNEDSISEKESLGKKMLESCSGLPLAINVLAALLASKNRVVEWRTMSEKVEEYLRGHNGSDVTSQVMALSYDYLPERLQICFQYLGNFPEDYEIPVKTLTQLWMAEGLIAPISPGSAANMEDASYSYLDVLVERCMVQVVKYSLTGNIKIIRLHDLMLELCRKKAKRDNFLHVVNSSEAKEIQAASFNKVRRLAVRLDGIGHELAPPSDEKHVSLRSLLFFVRGHYYSDMYRKLMRSLCKDFKLLRVLKFEDMKAEPDIELPSNIGNLVHLRFLSLKNSEIKRLPSSAANLVCLETLDLRCVEWVSVKIPNVFRKMAKLRHLYLPLNHRVTVTEKLSLATLHNLQTLVNISSQDCDLKDLIVLTNLRKLVLHAWGPTEFETLEKIMKDGGITFRHLRSLSLVTVNGNGDIPTHIVLGCPDLLKLQLYGRIKEFPEDHQFSNLTKLTLEETDLQDCHIERLEKLANLKVLSLGMGAFKSETMVFSEGGFRQLQFLSLLGLCELKEWTVERGAMPSLYSLHIGYCWGLRAVPDGLQHISTLKELTIKRMYREFCNRLGEGGVDFDTISHVPSVTITNIR